MHLHARKRIQIQKKLIVLFETIFKNIKTPTWISFFGYFTHKLLRSCEFDSRRIQILSLVVDLSSEIVADDLRPKPKRTELHLIYFERGFGDY